MVHSAENTTDLVLPDQGAEAVARFISTRPDPGSYHDLVDADSIVHVVDYDDEAFHDGTGGNRWSLGLSFACRAAQWPELPIVWRAEALRNAARSARMMADHVKARTGIEVPARRITAAQYRAGEPGFVTHADLDPTRRSDPGAAFPWGQFLTMFEQAGAAVPFECTHPLGCEGEIQQVLKDLSIRLGLPQLDPGRVDGDNGPKTAQAVHSVKNILLQALGLQ